MPLLLAVAAATAAIGLLSYTAAQARGNQTREYYIAADEVAWDYAPSGMDQMMGHHLGDDNVFVTSGPDRIGKVYVKALYREYTDESFSTLKPVAPEWRHLGTLGPVIHAVVGDTIIVHFKNNTRFPFTVHPHGVFYNKDSEGSLTNDGTSGNDKADDGVPPGGTHDYVWQVPERAGPGPRDPSSVVWLYHSHVDEPADTNAGLVGAIIVTRRGAAKPDGSPRDVDREFVTLFTVYDENSSLYLDENIETYTGEPESVNPDDEEFIESNLMHSINGYVFGNVPGLVMK